MPKLLKIFGITDNSNNAKLVNLKIISANNLPKTDIFGASDPYVQIKLVNIQNSYVLTDTRTKAIKKNLNPKWNQSFLFRVLPDQHFIVLKVYDENRITRDDFIGRIKINLDDLENDDQTSEDNYTYTDYLRAKDGIAQAKGKITYSISYFNSNQRRSSQSSRSSISSPTTSSSSPQASNSLFTDIEPINPQPLDVTKLENINSTPYESINESEVENLNSTSMEDFMQSLTLPEGWEQRTDANGRTYYVEHATRRVQTDHPGISQMIGSVEQAQDNTNLRHHISVDDDQNSGRLIVEGEEEEVEDNNNCLDNELTENSDSDLPANWEEKVSPSGRTFFIDHTNKKTTWIHPITGIESPKIDKVERQVKEIEEGLGKLPDGWEERIHNDGRTFFIDHKNKKTQWEDPRLENTSIAGQALVYNENYKNKYEKFKKTFINPLHEPRRQLKLIVSRGQMFQDSYIQIMLPSNHHLLRGRLDIEFIGERGLDYGGVSREWFYLLSKEIFNPYYGFFEYSAVDNYTLQINPYSGDCNEDHLKYFEFFGRVAGLAVLNGKLLDGFFIRPFYKMLLNKDITLQDMEVVDAEYYQSLIYIRDNDPSDLCLTFEIEEDRFGSKITKELVENGSQIEVTNDNKHEYIRTVIDHRFVSRIKPQMKSFRQGFNSVIPIAYLKNFNEVELELLLGGIANIDVRDWKANTEYKGGYYVNHKVIQWFWRLVLSLSNVMRARLLQFATGTSRVPSNGFKELYGSNGPRKFCIEMWGTPDKLPRAHTCFNRIDLPPYTSYKELVDKIILAIEGTEGFHTD